jgi:hypothetical protein
MANGWTPERQLKQSQMIRSWKPWELSTGAKTAHGKTISSMNALKTGKYTAQSREERQLRHKKVRLLIRVCRGSMRGEYIEEEINELFELFHI